MAAIWRYVLAHDAGMAPCPHDGLLSLTCCKPEIRLKASVGDWVIGFMPKQKMAPRIAWMGQVSAKLALGDYHAKYAGRPDALYRRNAAASTGPELLERDPSADPTYHPAKDQQDRDTRGRYALLFSPFWYWGKTPVYPPEEIADLAYPFIGQTSTGSTPTRLAALESWAAELPGGVQGTAGDPWQADAGDCGTPARGCRPIKKTRRRSIC